MGATCSKEDTRDSLRVANATSLLMDGLSDDAILNILSFVSYAPFEAVSENKTQLIRDYNQRTLKLFKDTRKSKIGFSLQNVFSGSGVKETSGCVVNSERYGTLTHVLPFVNKRINKITCVSGSTRLWSEALERNVRKHSSWEAGFKDVLEEQEKASIVVRSKSTITSLASSIEHALIELRRQDDKEDSLIPRKFYMQVREHRPVRLPIFRLVVQNFYTNGEVIHLFFFEPRYRLLIREVMANRNDRERSGLAIAAPRPRFLLASFGFATHAAVLVEVCRCRIRWDGTAEVSLVPVSDAPFLVSMTDVGVRPQTGGLQEATLSKTPSIATLPIFSMGGRVGFRLVLEDEIALRFFEERYKILIAEIMEGRTLAERQGQVMTTPLPQFLFVPGNRIMEARIVDVVQCTIHRDGTADLVGRTSSWCAIRSKRMRPRSAGLFEATVMLPTT